MSSVVPSIKSRFDYSGLDEDTRSRLEAAEVTIRGDLTRIKVIAVDVGSRLIEIKALIPNRFGAWIRDCCDFTERAAELYMSAAKFSNQYKALAGQLNQTAIYALAAPRLDDAVRRRVIEAVVNGRVQSSSEIQALIRREKRADAARVMDEGGKPVDDVAGDGVREFASILIGSLAESDLGRIRTILNSIATQRFSCLAAELASDVPADEYARLRQDS